MLHSSLALELQGIEPRILERCKYANKSFVLLRLQSLPESAFNKLLNSDAENKACNHRKML